MNIIKILKVNRKINTFLLALFLLSACKNFKEANTVNYTLRKIKSLKISIDSLTSRPLFASEVQVWENNLVLFNKRNQKIQFYDLNTGSFVRAISLEKDGENGIGQAKDFLIASKDSIFVVSPNQYKVFLLNSSGRVLENYRLINSSKPNSISAMPDPMPFYHPLFMIGNKLHISSIPDDNPYFDSFYQRKNLATLLDLNTKNISYHYGFPENYRKNIYPSNMNFYSRVYILHLKSFAYSFLQDEYIRLVSNDYSIEKKYQAVPKNFVAFKGLSKRIIDAFEDSRVGNTLPSFISIQYDSFRKRTYRVLQIPQIDEKGDILKNKFKNVLMEFDENLNKTKEIIFTDKSSYNPLNLFFTPEGMWIQRGTDNEDELVYDLIEFIDK